MEEARAKTLLAKSSNWNRPLFDRFDQSLSFPIKAVTPTSHWQR